MPRPGPEHPFWRGDDARSTTKRKRAQRTFSLVGVTCEYAGCVAPATDRHHIDGNTGHNVRANLQFLCRRHHMTVDGRLARLVAANADRPSKPPVPPVPCVNCARPSKPLRHGRCGACNEYLRRTGRERPYVVDGRRERAA